MNNILLIILFSIPFLSVNENDLYENNKTWLVTELIIGNELFEETTGTCVYESEIKFFKNHTYRTFMPCSGYQETETYKIIGNKLILKTDTLEILELSYSTMKTKMETKVQINGTTSQQIDIITTYAKK